MRNKELFQKIKELKLPIGKYVLFGSAPMGARGLKECQDADILVIKDLFEELRNMDWNYDKTESGSEVLRKENIEIFKDWKPGEWDAQKLIKEADIIEGLPFVKLEEVLRWKKLRAKEKDLKDIEIIENFSV